MSLERSWSRCAYCGDPFNNEDRKPIWEHVIPRDRGGCDHLANLVEACEDCNRGLSGLVEKGAMTPLEWWARQEWFRDGPSDVTSFDYAGWTLDQKQDSLLRCAYWEARARWHLMYECEKEARLSPFDYID